MRQLTFQRTVGAGAFGTVYQAELQTGRGFRRQVAVKVIQARGPDGDMFLSRIRDEARLLGLLQDDAILKVLDMVQIDGLDAVVMEYIEGADLDSLVRTCGPPTPQALAELGALVAGALHRAHTAVHPADGSPLGVVHRDVKPANIMVTRNGGVRLLDFGVARARFEARESYTGQLVLGTLNYMAPEYIVTNELSPAADIYGLGLSLYEAATGQVYGQPKVRVDSHEKRLRERIDQLAATMPALAPVVERMLTWDPRQRPDGAALEALLWEVVGGSRGPGLRPWATQAVPTVLDGRAQSADELGLVGQVVRLADEAAVPEAEARLPEAPVEATPGPTPSASPAVTSPAAPVMRSSAAPKGAPVARTVSTPAAPSAAPVARTVSTPAAPPAAPAAVPPAARAAAPAAPPAARAAAPTTAPTTRSAAPGARPAAPVMLAPAPTQPGVSGAVATRGTPAPQPPTLPPAPPPLPAGPAPIVSAPQRTVVSAPPIPSPPTAAPAGPAAPAAHAAPAAPAGFAGPAAPAGFAGPAAPAATRPPRERTLLDDVLKGLMIGGLVGGLLLALLVGGLFLYRA